MVGVVGCLASSRLLLSYVDSVCIGIVFVFIVFSYFLMKRYQSFGDVDWYGSNHAMLIVLYRFRVVLLLSWWHRVYRGGIVFIVMVTDPFGGKVRIGKEDTETNVADAFTKLSHTDRKRKLLQFLKDH